MGFYDLKWCRAVVERWEKNNQRVKSMNDAFTAWAGVLGVQDPREWVISREIYHLSRAKGRREWELLKMCVDQPIQWKYAFTEWIVPPSKPDWAEKIFQLQFGFDA